MRGLFVIVIVLFHNKFQPVYQWERCGVMFFFILSGFLLTLRHDFTHFDISGWWRFFIRRVSRVWPLHLLVWAVFMLIYLAFSVPFSSVASILNATLLHAWVPVHSICMSVNVPSWFLSAIVFCYCCFPLLRVMTHRVRLRYQFFCAIAVAVGLTALLPMLSRRYADFLYFFPPARLFDFFLGMLLAQFYQLRPQGRPQYGQAMATVIELSVLLILIQVWFLARYTDMLAEWTDAVIWWLPVSMLIFCFASHDGCEGWIGRLLRSRPLVMMGDISFEIFLLHMIVPFAYSYCVAPIFGHYGIDVYYVPLALRLVMIVAVSWAAHRWFTIPLQSRMRKYFERVPDNA